jgi:transglutaminase-like putative cysteine protease
LEIRVGYELIYDCPQPTPMMLVLHVHYSRASDFIVPDQITTTPSIPMSAYRDGFGNWCTRLVAPPGRLVIASAALVRDSGAPDVAAPLAQQHSIEELPEDALVFLLGSRYCDTEKFTDVAWRLFGRTPMGWGRVQAICDFVHNHISFGYEHARATRTAWEAFNEQVGVCRDFAHLAIALCRSMNIPARYCTGYLGDIGVPPPYGPMDFAAWFEAYLGGRWYTFDPRNNVPRIGRVLMARGRDAIDVAIATTFGPNTLASFKVWTATRCHAYRTRAAPPIKVRRSSVHVAESLAQLAEHAEGGAQVLVSGDRLEGGVAAHPRLGLAVVLGELAPGIGAGIALRHALAEEIEAAQHELAFGLALLRGLAQPEDSLLVVDLHAEPAVIHEADAGLGARVVRLRERPPRPHRGGIIAAVERRQPGTELLLRRPGAGRLDGRNERGSNEEKGELHGYSVVMDPQINPGGAVSSPHTAAPATSDRVPSGRVRIAR